MKKVWTASLFTGLVGLGSLGYIGFKNQQNSASPIYHKVETNEFSKVIQPQVLDEYDENKNARWTDAQAENHQNELLKLLSRNSAPTGGNSGGNASGGSVSGGLWIPRGPYNQPGCWEFSEFDSTANTVWSITCAHYGGSQFIHKGSLKGDDFKLISGNFPNEYNDMRFVPISDDKRRLVVATTAGGIFYTDDDGENWVAATGVSGVIQSLTVNRQQSHKVYATDGQKIFVSPDGKSFSVLQDLGSKKLSRIYSPKYIQQNGSDQVYVAHGTDFYALNSNKTAFVKKGTGTWPTTKDKRFAIGGDARKIYVTNHEDWWKSTNEGVSWTKVTESNWASAWSGWMIATHPENPDTVVMGYLNPVFSQDGLQTVWGLNIWGGHQVWSPSDPDERHRVRIHADHQATQFFYDKSGKLFTLHSTDGGLMVSYKDWAQNQAYWTSGSDGRYPTDTYRNINLMGCMSRETYHPAMATGAKNPDHSVFGVQDQGTQTHNGTQGSHGTMLNFKQSPYGDGPRFISGDGLSGWGVSGGDITAPFAMYNGENFVGVANRSSTNSKNPGIGNLVGWHPDKQNPGTEIWVRSTTAVAKMTWNGSALSSTNKTPASGWLNALGQSASNPAVLYVHQGGKLYRSANGGSTWSAGVSTGISNSSGNCGIWVSPKNENQVLVACGNSGTRSVYSADGGNSIEDVSGNLAQAGVNAVVADSSGKWAFASTNLGAWRFNVSTKTWTLISDGKNAPIFNGKHAEFIPSINTVRFSTWGSGLWDYRIDDGKPFIIISNPGSANTFMPGDTLKVEWLSNWTGSISLSIWKAGQKIKDLGSVTADAKSYEWIVDIQDVFGKDFFIKLESTSSLGYKQSAQFAIYPQLIRVENSHLSIAEVDSEEAAATAAQLLDDDLSTIWHTEWQYKQPEFPHWVVLESDTTLKMAALQYFPRSGNINGRVKDYVVLGSINGSTWDTLAQGTLADQASGQYIFFSTIKEINQIKFLALNEQRDNYYANAAELQLYYMQEVEINVNLEKRIALSALKLTAAQNGIYYQTHTPAKIEVYDLNGRKLWSQRVGITQSAFLDLSELQSGSYIVRLNNKSRHTSIRWSKNH